MLLTLHKMFLHLIYNSYNFSLKMQHILLHLLVYHKIILSLPL